MRPGEGEDAMTDVRRYDTAENRAYWRHAEKVAREWRETAPGWATCSRCGERYDRHVTRYACVLKPAAQEDARAPE